MQSTTASILAFSLFLASSLHAQFNPLDWFGGEDEDLVALNVASAADESEANSSSTLPRQSLPLAALVQLNASSRKSLRNTQRLLRAGMLASSMAKFS